MTTDQPHGAPETAATAETLSRMSQALNARSWREVSSGIPAWHPRMEEVEDEDATTTEPPAQTADQDPEVDELPFKLDDIDENFTLTGEDARKWLLTRQAQLQAPTTRKAQELAVQRAEVEALAELKQKLSDPESSLEALMALAKEAGVELEFDSDEDPDEQGPEPDDPLEAEVNSLREWKEQQEEQARTQAEQAARTEAEQEFNQHAVSEMERIAQSLNTTLDEMSAEDKQDIVARALTAPALASGLPDFDAGLAEHLKYKELVSKAAVEAYAKSKQVLNPGVNGSSGSRVANLRDTNERVAAAAAIADRHYTTS